TRLVSDWSSDVCSSDLLAALRGDAATSLARRRASVASPRGRQVVPMKRLLVLVVGLFGLVAYVRRRRLNELTEPEPAAELRAKRSEERRVGTEGGARRG